MNTRREKIRGKLLDHSFPKRCKKSRTSAIRKTRVVLHIFKIFTGIV